MKKKLFLKEIRRRFFLFPLLFFLGTTPLIAKNATEPIQSEENHEVHQNQDWNLSETPCYDCHPPPCQCEHRPSEQEHPNFYPEDPCYETDVCDDNLLDSYVIDDCCYRFCFELIAGGAYGKTVGLDENYGFFGTQISILSPSGLRYHGIEANAYILEGNDWAGNFNAFTRWYDECLCSSFGLSLFYDFRQGCLKTFHQVGLRFEGYFPCFFLTGNIYLPITNTRARTKKCVFDDYIGDFRATSRRVEYAFYGFNVDIGKTFCLKGDLEFHPSVGPYYFVNRKSDFWGVRFNAGFRLRSRLGLDINITYDRVYNTRAQALLFFTIPLGSCCDPCCDQFSQPIDRFRIMPLIQCCEYDVNW